MKLHVLLSALLASLLLGGIVAGLLILGPSHSENGESQIEARKASIEVGTPPPAQQEPRGRRTGSETVEVLTPPSPKEIPIEDILAESGEEDPEAIYYMSRIREAMREGNPPFAQELLQRMKGKHPSSVLVEEAEALVQGER